MSTPTMKRVNIDTLVIDTRYQRHLNEHRIGKMVDEWNPGQQGVLEVSKRDNGTYAVFDGQHRLAALKAMGRKTAPCNVHEGLDAQGEASLFVRLQADRRSPTPVERFKAQVFSGDKDAIRIANIIAESGFRTGTNTGDLRAIVAIERVARKHGDDVLRQTLEAIRDIWYGDEYALDGLILSGFGQFLSDYGSKFTERHADRLRTTLPILIKRRAAAIGVGGNGQAAHAVALHIRKACGITGKTKPAREMATA
jgi:ParB-like nuclease domain